MRDRGECNRGIDGSGDVGFLVFLKFPSVFPASMGGCPSPVSFAMGCDTKLHVVDASIFLMRESKDRAKVGINKEQLSLSVF